MWKIAIKRVISTMRIRMNKKLSVINNLLVPVLMTALLLSFTECKEYCSGDHFEASCNESQVIMMERAQYGRMRLGGCIKTGQLGCISDMMHVLDRECSGRRFCRKSVVAIDQINNCASDTLREMRMYLDASYSCVDDGTADFLLDQTISPTDDGSDAECASQNPFPKKSPAYISSNAYYDVGVATESCPWKLEGLPGQQITLEIFDFTLSSEISRVTQGGNCPAQLVAQEGTGLVERRPLCNGSLRQRWLYTSSHHQVGLWLNMNFTHLDRPYFMIKYTIEGCANLETPANGILERSGNDLTMRCNGTKTEVWYMVCKGSQWIGPMGNCTTGDGEDGDEDEDTNKSEEFPMGIVIAVAIGIGVGIVVGLVLLGLVFACRRCHRCRQKSRERTEQPHDLSQIEVPYPKCYPPGHQPPPHPHGGPQAGPSGPHSGDISAISHPGLVGGYPGGQRGGMYPKHVHPVIPTPRNPASPDGYHYPDDRAPMPLPPEAHEMADKCHLQQQGEHIYEKTPGQYMQQGSLRSSKGPGAKNKNM